MNPRELVVAAVRHHDLTVRQLVKDAAREAFSWSEAPAPDFSQTRLRAVYAGLVELFAERQGQAPPAWTKEVGPAPKTLFLVRQAKTSKALRRMSEAETPAPLKSRNVRALADYLDVL
jgi:hypothetical protein